MTGGLQPMGPDKSLSVCILGHFVEQDFQFDEFMHASNVIGDLLGFN